MNHLNKKSTLIDKLKNIVDSKHLEEIKKVISALAEINEFKYIINNLETIEEIYTEVQILLKSKFNIKDFKVKQYIDTIETIKYETSDIFIANYSYRCNINTGILEFVLDNSHLGSFDKLYLENYLEEISYILYVKLVLVSLELSAMIDPLTNLKNRLSFNEEMKEIIPLAIRENMKIGVLLINIDRFRAVNDEHGIQFGDEFLRLYAKSLKNSIRNSDIAVRFGGGEFLVLLMNVLDYNKTVEIATHIQEKLTVQYLLTPSNDKFQKTVSIGISMFPEDSDNMDISIKNAEQALIDARDISRGKILRYEENDGELDLF
ncbi:MAG: GGDEF domain-containing protein [Arcobacteraceae bacterium]|nr:GGDEF domain-containing protein [Arcobacteraceae bacterium]